MLMRLANATPHSVTSLKIVFYLFARRTGTVFGILDSVHLLSESVALSRQTRM
jgi:hypothetical protein